MSQIARYIDHSVLGPLVDDVAIQTACRLALRHNIHSVVVASGWVEDVVLALLGSDVTTCSTISFPHGNTEPDMEIEDALADGAKELDVVLNLPALQHTSDNETCMELKALTHLVPDDIILKVIIEIDYLDYKQIDNIVELCQQYKIDYIKTSTGFNVKPMSMSERCVRDQKIWYLLQQCRNAGVLVKVSGGIDTYQKAQNWIDNGASRIGTSHTEKIIREEKEVQAERLGVKEKFIRADIYDGQFIQMPTPVQYACSTGRGSGKTNHIFELPKPPKYTWRYVYSSGMVIERPNRCCCATDWRHCFIYCPRCGGKL